MASCEMKADEIKSSALHYHLYKQKNVSNVCKDTNLRGFQNKKASKLTLPALESLCFTETEQTF